MHSAQLRLARTLYHEWRILPPRERRRIASLADEVKELALDLRGMVDRRRAEAELALANETLAIAIVDAAEHDRTRSDDDIDSLRRYLQAEIERATLSVAA
jgi:hypothetical protein